MYFKAGLVPDISKLESWTHVGRTANIIIKDIAHIFASICKNMHILLMGRRYRERCKVKSDWRTIPDGVPPILPVPPKLCNVWKKKKKTEYDLSQLWC